MAKEPSLRSPSHQSAKQEGHIAQRTTNYQAPRPFAAFPHPGTASATQPRCRWPLTSWHDGTQQTPLPRHTPSISNSPRGEARSPMRCSASHHPRHTTLLYILPPPTAHISGNFSFIMAFNHDTLTLSTIPPSVFYIPPLST